MSLAQTIALYKLPCPPARQFPLGMIVEYFGRPWVPWYLCGFHGHGFYCELCKYNVGSFLVSPAPHRRCTLAPLRPSPASQPAARASQPTAPPDVLPALGGRQAQEALSSPTRTSRITSSDLMARLHRPLHRPLHCAYLVLILTIIFIPASGASASDGSDGANDNSGSRRQPIKQVVVNFLMMDLLQIQRE